MNIYEPESRPGPVCTVVIKLHWSLSMAVYILDPVKLSALNA